MYDKTNMPKIKMPCNNIKECDIDPAIQEFNNIQNDIINKMRMDLVKKVDDTVIDLIITEYTNSIKYNNKTINYNINKQFVIDAIKEKQLNNKLCFPCSVNDTIYVTSIISNATNTFKIYEYICTAIMNKLDDKTGNVRKLIELRRIENKENNVLMHHYTTKPIEEFDKTMFKSYEKAQKHLQNIYINNNIKKL